MNSSKSLKEAVESLKEFRNNAQAVADAQINLLSIIIDQANQLSKIPSENRTKEQDAVLDFYFTFADKVDASLEAADKYNKSLTKYVKGITTISNLASFKNENN